ncbi:MAG: YkvA family protein [Patescibacteria group bacterium]|nr:YkvA family protein [Patescibacteria group bacterium]
MKKILSNFKREIGVYRCVLRHPKTPKMAKWVLAAAVAYTISPIDLIPDFIPLLGQLDDLIIVPSLILIARMLIPADIIAECRKSALAHSTPPVSHG